MQQLVAIQFIDRRLLLQLATTQQHILLTPAAWTRSKSQIGVWGGAGGVGWEGGTNKGEKMREGLQSSSEQHSKEQNNIWINKTVI